MAFIDDLRSDDKKGLFNSNDTFINYPTGILPLDYANGFWHDIIDENGNKTQVPIIGLMGGNIYTIIGDTGTGKELPVDTMIPVPTEERYKRLGDLCVGDLVYNRELREVSILGYFPQGKKRVYRVELSDGRSAKCGLEHLWSIMKDDGIYTISTQECIDLLRSGEKLKLPIVQPNTDFVVMDDGKVCVFNSEARHRSNILNELIFNHYDHQPTPHEYLLENKSITFTVNEAGIKEVFGYVDGMRIDDMDDLEMLDEYNHSLTIKEDLDEVYNLGHSLGFTVRLDQFEINKRYPRYKATFTMKLEDVYITSITDTNQDVDQACIYVNDPEHIFLTESYIPTHNTTLADQMAYNIIKGFEDSFMMHVDAERTALIDRIFRIAGIPTKDNRVVLNKDKTSVEDVNDIINRICALKEAHGDKMKYEVEGKSSDGKPFKVYYPTVIIVDALPSFNSKNQSTEDLGTNMDAAIAAKHITRFINNILDVIYRYNITVFLINHIRQKIEVNQYAPAPKGVMMLKQTETLARGGMAQFMSQGFFKLSMVKGNMYTMEDNGFEGFKATLQIAKTKTNFVGATISVTFNKDIGFDPIYTLYEFADSVGLVQGRNPYLYIQGMDTFKFDRRDFRKRFIDNTVFREELMKILRPYLESLLGVKTVTEEDLVKFGDLMEIESGEYIQVERPILDGKKKKKK